MFDIIGKFLVFYVLLKFLFYIINKFLRSPYNLLQRYGENSWAVVTGASDGLGKGFCEQLAATGFNVCLIARNKEKLEACEKELNEKYPKIQTKVIVFDFSFTNEKNINEEIIQNLEKLDVSLLINNVGIGEEKQYHDISLENIKDCINVNIFSQTILSNYIIKKMLKRNLKSGIINVSSVIKYLPIPTAILYGASKSYNDYFSKGIESEYFEKIDSLSYTPGYITTKMIKYKKDEFAISPEIASKSCLRDLGKKIHTNGHFYHDYFTIVTILLSYFPKALCRYFLIMNQKNKNENK